MFTISCPPKVVWLGREGENEFRTIEVEVSEWLREYPNGTISVVYHRPDDSIYMPTVTTSGNITRWLITSTDTSFTGRGEAEFRIIDGDVVGKSVKMPTMVSDGINATTDDPDSAPADWTVEAGRLQNEIDDLDDRVTELKEDLDSLDERVEELEQHGTGGGIPDAPVDGKQYARKDGAWSEVQSGTSYDDTVIKARVKAIEDKESTWDAKQDAITDLATIRSGAALGATALQSVPSEYAKKTDIPTAEISANTAARHTHDNKTLLDKIAEGGIGYTEGEATTIEWDGDTSGLASFSLPDKCYKISDIPQNFNPQNIVRIDTTYGVADFSINYDYITYGIIGYDVGELGSVVIICLDKDKASLAGVQIDENGIYSCYRDDEDPIRYVTEITYTAETIHKIDTKYLPIYDGSVV